MGGDCKLLYGEPCVWRGLSEVRFQTAGPVQGARAPGPQLKASLVTWLLRQVQSYFKQLESTSTGVSVPCAALCGLPCTTLRWAGR